MFHGAGEVWIRHVHVTGALQTKMGEFTHFGSLYPSTVTLDDYYIGKVKNKFSTFYFCD